MKYRNHGGKKKRTKSEIKTKTTYINTEITASRRTWIGGVFPGPIKLETAGSWVNKETLWKFCSLSLYQSS